MATTLVYITAVQGLVFFDEEGFAGKIVHAKLEDPARELSIGVDAAEVLAVEDRTFEVQVNEDPNHVKIETPAREVLIEHDK